jgi:hypothetical protein
VQVILFVLQEINLDPASILSTVDHGDDMQMRLRYQATYAALVALALLIDSTEIVELYCEHHEDVLLRKGNGKFQGCQVKTRLARIGPFKADDEQIRSALSRFVALDLQFPDHFESFVIATNVGFWQGAKNGKSLPFLIELAQGCDAKAPKASREIHKFVSALSSEHKCKAQAVWHALGKVLLQPELPQFHDIEKQLAVRIGEVLRQTHRRFDELLRAAKALVQLMTDASSKSSSSPLIGYFVFVTKPESAEEAVVIEAKRISKERFLKSLVANFDDSVLLSSGNRVDVRTLPTGMTTIEKKMAAGGVATNEINLAKDFKFSMDRLLQEWMYKYGDDEAARRYDHLQLIVKEDCFEASAQTKAAGPYGTAMLGRVRANLRTSTANQGAKLAALGISYNHLLGVAGILTEDCTVWWSDEFDLRDDGGGSDAA